MYFWIGAAVYPMIEIAWRGRTHPAMALAGGLAGAVLGKISKTNRPLRHQALLGGLAITGIEYAMGRWWNRNYRIWDYRNMPLNVQGQVCLPYTLAWCALSAAVLPVFRLTARRRAG